MSFTSRSRFLTTLALAACLTPACSGGGADAASTDSAETACKDPNDATCVDTTRVQDPSKLDLGDLIKQGAKFSGEQVLDQIEEHIGPSGAFFISKPAFFGTDETVAADANAENPVKSLKELTTGLATKLGETELSTEANAVRLAYLMSNTATPPDKVFAESSMKIAAGFMHQWSMTSEGFHDGHLEDEEGGVQVGFQSGVELETRVISAFDGEYRKTLGVEANPVLSVLKRTRGFAYPSKYDDVAKMKAGESWAVTGKGKIGANVGVGVPLLVINPVSVVGIQIVASAAFRTLLEGEVDVQLIRLDGDKVVVDIGIDKVSSKTMEVGLVSRWGLQGLLNPSVSVGPVKIELGKILEEGIKARVEKYTGFTVAASASTVKERLSVTRLLFHMNAGNRPEMESALAQAIRGDVRLAQGIYNRDLYSSDAATSANPPVTVTFDLSRNGVTKTRSFGIDAFGMSVLHRDVVKKDSAVVIQTPTGAEELMFSEVERSGSGLFGSGGHLYNRTGIAGMDFTTKGGVQKSETNLVFTVAQSTNHMHNAMMIDSADALIGAVAGPAAVDTMNGADPLGAFTAALSSVPESYRPLLLDAANTRIALRADGLPKGGLLSGPKAAITVDYRLDNASIEELMTKSGDDFKSAVLDYLATVGADRSGKKSRAEVRASVEADRKDTLKKMADLYTGRAAQYNTLLQREQGALSQILQRKMQGQDGAIGVRALVVRYEVDSNRRVDLAKSTIGSPCEQRTNLLLDLVDGEIKLAGGLHAHLNSENAVAYPMLALAPKGRIVVHMNIAADKDNGLAGLTATDQNFFGAESTPIGAGLFDINKVAGAKDADDANEGSGEE